MTLFIVDYPEEGLEYFTDLLEERGDDDIKVVQFGDGSKEPVITDRTRLDRIAVLRDLDRKIDNFKDLLVRLAVENPSTAAQFAVSLVERSKTWDTTQGGFARAAGNVIGAIAMVDVSLALRCVDKAVVGFDLSFHTPGRYLPFREGMVEAARLVDDPRNARAVSTVRRDGRPCHANLDYFLSQYDRDVEELLR